MNSVAYIKIAVFVAVLGTAGASYVVLSVNGIGALNTHTYEAVLDDASGLSTRSKVYLAGVPVGKVKNIDLNGNEARITIILLKDVELRRDAVLARRPSSLLGTSVLSLDPGTSLSPIVSPGSLINSAPPPSDLNTAMELVQDLGGEIIQLLQEFRTSQMALLAVSLETFNSIVQKIDSQSEGQLNNISRILESVALISERSERLLRSGEEGISGSIAEINEALMNIKLITAEIVAGRGNLGQAIYDDQLYASILATAEKTGTALENITLLVQNTDTVVTDAGEIVKKALGLGIMVDTNARYDILAETVRASASIRLDPASNDRWYRVGISTTPDGVASRTVKETIDHLGNSTMEDTTTTKYTVAFDIELARRFGMFTIRGGLLENSGGFGLDLQPVKWLGLSSEVFSFKTGEYPNLRGTLTFYPFFNPDSDKPWNWIYLRGGINNALSDNRDYFIGGGLRFADREVKGLVGLAPIFN